jgi:hypothetical protein
MKMTPTIEFRTMNIIMVPVLRVSKENSKKENQ